MKSTASIFVASGEQNKCYKHSTERCHFSTTWHLISSPLSGWTIVWPSSLETYTRSQIARWWQKSEVRIQYNSYTILVFAASFSSGLTRKKRNAKSEVARACKMYAIRYGLLLALLMYGFRASGRHAGKSVWWISTPYAHHAENQSQRIKELQNKWKRN